ncbi:MAG: response regulator [Ancylobacter novellus]|uniref:Response regulator n=1 Tax=Ancylobacter novellus TaxID=921 RepID=A0A2W5KPM7_ANCNO|nr:MAG: response regulator [Ancylobacter novellus]
MRVLIVEDDMVVAGSLGPVVTAAGHELVGLAADRDTAVELLASAGVHLALIDLRLADGWTGADVARAAARHDVAAVFTTANPTLLPSDFADALGVIPKPYSSQQVKAALDYIAERMADEAHDAVPPRCLHLGPRWLASAETA